MATLNKTTFNGGELSPWLSPRIDLEKYHTGVATLENMNVVRYGGVRARAGTLFINEVKDSLNSTSLKGFDFSRQDSVVVEFGDLYARFYKDGAQLGAPYEIVTPFAAADVKFLQFAQRNDVIIVTHPNYPPQEMRHMGDEDWSINEIPWKSRPWQDLNDTTTTMTPSALTGLGITITASVDTFVADDVGSIIRIVHGSEEVSNDFTLKWAQKPSDFISGRVVNDDPVKWFADNPYYLSNLDGQTTNQVITGSSPYRLYTCEMDYVPAAWLVGTNYIIDDVVHVGGASGYWAIQASLAVEPEVTVGWEDYWQKVDDPTDAPQFFDEGIVIMEPVTVSGRWEFETSGTWKGEWKIQRSYNLGVSWNTIKTTLSSNNKNFAIAEEEDSQTPALYRVIATRNKDVDIDTDSVVFRILSEDVTGEALITAFVDEQEVTADVLVDFEATDPSTEWSFNGFNPKLSYPAACAFHEERLYLGGVPGDPQTLWASITNDYYNFLIGTEDDDGMKFTLAANSYDGITWFKSHKTLLIGTSGSIWSLASAEDAPVTPGNRRARVQTALGSEAIAPINLNDATVYVQRKSRRVNELVGDAYSGYGVVDLTELAEHITRSGIIQIAHVTQPDTMLLCVRDDGEMSVLTYDKANRISGWCRYITDGVIESVTTLYGQDEDDEIYMIVRRSIGKDEKRYIERIKPDMLRAEESNNVAEFVYQDSAKVWQGTPKLTITDLDHLEERVVQVLADGAYAGEFTVENGQIELTQEAGLVVVGLKYTATMKTMPIEAGQTLGERKRVNGTYIRLKDTVGAEISQGGGVWNDIPARDGYDNMNEAVPVKSWDYVATLPNISKREMSIEVRQDRPLPLSIIALMPNVKTGSK